jgi:hypothetical protein
MIIIEMNTKMRNDRTCGLGVLSPIDTSSTTILTLYYLNQHPGNVDVFTVTDKLNQLDLSLKNFPESTKLDLDVLEDIFKEVI